MKINNTLAFEPTTTDTFPTLVNAEKRGQIFITDGEVTKGQDIIDHIKSNADKSFLVSKPAFDHLASLGYKNVCMFDPTKTVYEGDKATAQGGVIFA